MESIPLQLMPDGEQSLVYIRHTEIALSVWRLLALVLSRSTTLSSRQGCIPRTLESPQPGPA